MKTGLAWDVKVASRLGEGMSQVEIFRGRRAGSLRAGLRLTGTRSEIVASPLPADDPVRRCPDLTQARTVVGWQARVPFEEGLARTIEDVRRRLAHPKTR